MLKNMRKGIALLISALMLLALLPVSSVAEGQALVYSDEYNSGVRHQKCESLDGTGAEDYLENNGYDFYELADMSSDDLLGSLRSLMTKTHTKITNYDNCRDNSPKVDCENADGTTVVLLYSSIKTDMDHWTSKFSGGWNREHVWPQSLGNFGESRGGADLHHVRPADSSANFSRNNKLYGESEPTTGTTYTNPAMGKIPAGTYNSTYFEPLDEVKGDVARICLYVYVRWGSEYPGYCDDITNVFESVDVLLEWCALDPVDTWEMGRNEVVEAIQGNRNVFIDYPELAWVLFDRDIPTDMDTPSGISEDEGKSLCKHRAGESYIVGETQPDCLNGGYTGDEYCSNCDRVIKQGEYIGEANGHDFGDWQINENMNYTHICSHCKEQELLTVNLAGQELLVNPEILLVLMSLGAGDSVLLNGLAAK